MTTTTETPMKLTTEERREQKINLWLDRIREWDWLPVDEALNAEIARRQEIGCTPRGSFVLGGARRMMQQNVNRRDYSPQEWWLEEYCFMAALRTVTSNWGLELKETDDGGWYVLRTVTS